MPLPMLCLTNGLKILLQLTIDNGPRTLPKNWHHDFKATLQYYGLNDV